MTSQKSIGLPDVHSGYGFAIGNMAAFDMSDPAAVVSPGRWCLPVGGVSGPERPTQAGTRL